MFDKKPVKDAFNSKTKNVSRKEKAHSSEGRPERISSEGQTQLGLPSGLNPNKYGYRWVVENSGRVQQMVDAWWEPCKDSRGELYRKDSGEEKLVLYRILREYYEEDIKKAQQKPLNSLKQQAQFQEGEYLPDGHDSVLTINK